MKLASIRHIIFGGFVAANLLCGLLVAAAQAQVAEEFVVNRWTVAEGLPANSVNDLLQARNGYLWMATYNGLIRFDGIQFKIFNTASHPELPSNRITDLFEAPDSSLWIITEQDSLVYFQKGHFTQITEANSPYIGSKVYAVTKDAEGTLWFGSDKGITRYKGGRLLPFYPDRIQGMIDRLFIQKDGILWFHKGYDRGIYRLQSDSIFAVAKTLEGHDVIPMAENKHGFWFATGIGFYRFVNDSLQLITRRKAENAIIYALQTDDDGELLMATWSDLYSYESGRAGHLLSNEIIRGEFLFTDKQGAQWIVTNQHLYRNGVQVFYSEEVISAFLIDREGSFWIGTGGGGLLHLKENPFLIYNSKDGLPNSNIYPVMEAQDGTVWVGTHGGGVARIKNGKVETGYRLAGSAKKVYVRSLEQMSNGTILMGISSRGIWYKKPGTGKVFYEYATPEALKTETAAAIYEDSRGRLWVGSSAGLYLQKDNDWKYFGPETGFPSQTVRFITEAPDGSIWMATNGAGIVQFANGTFKLYARHNGLSGNIVRSLHIEPSENPDNYLVWIGYEGIGLSRLPVVNQKPRLSSITHYRKSDGLFANVIHRILDDGNGNFWMSSNQGIFRLSKVELEAMRNGNTDRLHPLVYTKTEGLLNSEGNGGMQPAGIKTDDGRLWFPTQNGVVVIEPDSMFSNKKMPPVIIEQVSSGGEIMPSIYSESIRLTPQQRSFEIDYTALSLLNARNNRFQYKLEGFNDKWVEAGSRRTAYFTGIDAGEYTFRVKAANNDGVWNETGDMLHIIIEPYFYETTLFYLLCGLFLIGFVYGGVRLRTRRLEASEKRLKAMVKERTLALNKEKQKSERQAKKLKELDTAKSRFFANLSHEFRTPLTLIMNPLKQMLSGAWGKVPQKVNEHLGIMQRHSYRLLRLIEQLLDLSKLEENKEHIHVVKSDPVSFTRTICELFVETAKANGLELHVDFHEAVDNIWIDADKMEKVIANLLTNAIKYTGQGGKIRVTFEDTSAIFKIHVQDTGVGISKEKQRHIFERFYQVESGDARRAEGVGIGLSLVKAFTELHGGHIEVASAPGEGSRFTINLTKGNKQFSKDELRANGGNSTLSFKNEEESDFENLPFPPLIEHNNNNNNEKEADETIAAGDDRTTLLIVEDNTDLRSFLCDLLSQTYRVLDAANGIEALKIIDEKLPDLIVADIMMPELDGRRLNRKLKEDPATASIPLIFLTAKAAPDAMVEGLLDGADAYLTKPFDTEVLQAHIANLLESRLRLRKIYLQQNRDAKPKLEFEKETNDPFLSTLNEALESRFSDPSLNVKLLAELMNMSRPTLYRKTKDKTGLSIQEYLLRYRLEKAALSFRREHGSVSEIAYASGFNSLSYFSKKFSNQFGMKPSEYIKHLTTGY